MKYAIVILDGAAGYPLDVWGKKTTLEAANTPNLDKLCEAGEVGLAKNTPDGFEASSNIACTSICGYDPAKYPIGRGALEGAALGINLAADEVAMRTNLVNISQDGIMVSYSTDNISSDDGSLLYAELAAALDDDTFTLHTGTGFRGILVVKGHTELMDAAFPAAHNMADEPVDKYAWTGPKGVLELIRSYEARAKEVLANSPVNVRRAADGKMCATDLLAFWPGQKPGSMEPFYKAYGKRACMISGVDLLQGIAMLSDIDCRRVAGVTDGADNDYAAQGAAAVEALNDYDVVICHVEAPDAEGHDGNAVGKKEAVEAIDREIVARLCDYAKDANTPDLRILALPDHPTPVATKRHGQEMVPFVMAGDGIEHNGAKRLTEAMANATGLVVDPGCALMGKLLS
ncbi:MAG: 2,3-bisphosphoglycerate-independent phosphoglycerate mutase [Coriobacteriales bacterium]|jgi:2,3-bisphosphoglycerate-independent phosphoglycerate mutase|nr:2,3-bisphosphoglycerate-independent phosphoglycerate mutase [Coriobacteriales bacterium]